MAQSYHGILYGHARNNYTMNIGHSHAAKGKLYTKYATKGQLHYHKRNFCIMWDTLGWILLSKKENFITNQMRKENNSSDS